jgi:intracellular sulfur oxidation DsrE/DsrF family protein
MSMLLKLTKALLFILACNVAYAAELDKVVYHINESSKAPMLISSVKELLKSDHIGKIKVIVHGSAVLRLSKRDGLSNDFASLMGKGVDIGVCNPSMMKKNLKHEQILEGVEFIAEGGVVRIIQLQKQGYVYIKI